MPKVNNSFEYLLSDYSTYWLNFKSKIADDLYQMTIILFNNSLSLQ
jgi:hypothetical protein